MSKPFVHTFIFIFAISIFNACTPMQESQSIQEPKAAKKPHRLEKHGDVRIDNYYWLRERENPEVIDYLNSENAYREQIMKGTEDLQTYYQLQQPSTGIVQELPTFTTVQNGLGLFTSRIIHSVAYFPSPLTEDSLEHSMSTRDLNFRFN